MINLIEYGFNPAMMPENGEGIPARITDCRHKSEPGCAIKEAIESGELPAERWNSYLQIKHEVEFTDDKAAFLQEKEKRNKSISQWSRQMKKNGWIKK